MFRVEHASSTGPAVMEEGRRGERSNRLPVKFPQVLASSISIPVNVTDALLILLWLQEKAKSGLDIIATAKFIL